jgi:2-polyprenyl-3-methyl-5-hydroxy-6-metoxy-1,4-benzoquinol methylase
MNGATSQTTIRDEKKVIEERYGPWTAHNFNLGHDVFTIRDGVIGDEVKLRRVVQVVADVCDRPISDLRILDLACLEGMYAIEFSQQGAHVSAIEGRETNVEKARFAARTLSLSNIEFHQDDVRNLSEEKYGRFDVVLCLGILYHLDSPDVFTFLEKVFAVCRRVAIIDTVISPYPEQSFFYRGKRYLGKIVPEHAPSASSEEKQKNLWASLDNPTATHLTRVSLYSLLYDVGFTSVYECHIPQEPEKPMERVTFVAIRGTAIPPVSCPQLSEGYARDLAEELSPAIRRGLKLVSRYIPDTFKRLVKQLLFPAK